MTVSQILANRATISLTAASNKNHLRNSFKKSADSRPAISQSQATLLEKLRKSYKGANKTLSQFTNIEVSPQAVPALNMDLLPF